MPRKASPPSSLNFQRCTFAALVSCPRRPHHLLSLTVGNHLLLGRDGLVCFGAGQSVGLGAGLDEGGVEGELVHDRCAERGSVNVLDQPLNASLEAMAMLFFSSCSVSTWKSTAAPRQSSSR